MVTTRPAIAVSLLLVAGVACQTGGACPGFCTGDRAAILDMSCAPSDLATVAQSGPCSAGDASPPNYGSSKTLAISSSSPGTCHVVRKPSTVGV
jgi:hypothetical protein